MSTRPNSESVRVQPAHQRVLRHDQLHAGHREAGQEDVEDHLAEPVLEGTDACLAPLLTLSETAARPHTVHRRTIAEVGGIRQAAPAPRLSRTAGRLGRPLAPFGQGTVEVLTDWGIPAERVQERLALGAVARPE